MWVLNLRTESGVAAAGEPLRTPARTRRNVGRVSGVHQGRDGAVTLPCVHRRVLREAGILEPEWGATGEWAVLPVTHGR